MTITLTEAARNAACDAIVDLVDAGAGAGYCEIKSSASTTGGTPGANNEVATVAFADPAFGAAASGVASLASDMSPDTDATGGTASHYTVFDSDNTACWQGSVTATGGGGDLELSSVSIGAGDTVTISSFTVTVPAS